MLFASGVRSARTTSGLTQTQLANQAGCSVHAVWELERGNGTVALLERIASALDLRFVGLPPGTKFADRVRLVRQRRGWSVQELAQAANLSPMALYRLEAGNARVASLEAVLRVLAPKVRVGGDFGARWRRRRVRSHVNHDRRFTPVDVLERLHAVVGEFDLDPAGDRDSPVVARSYSYKEDDGLSHPWFGTTFCNPPYSATSPFVRKAFESWRCREASVVVLLLPARTQLAAFHDCIAGYADVFFLRHRISFILAEVGRGKLPFGSMVVIFGADDGMVARMVQLFECTHLPRR
jgi:phage N-6-adenine-methyltransferase